MHTVLVFTMIFVGLLYLLVTSAVSSQTQIDTTELYSFVDERHGVEILMGIDHEANEAVAHVSYQQDTVEGIQNYVEYNDLQLAQLAKNLAPKEIIPVEITFSKPLTQSEFEQFVKESGVTVEKYHLFAVTGTGRLPGEIHTIGGNPSDTELVPEDSFELTVAGVKEFAGKDARLLGWVTLYGETSIAQISEIKSREDVFLVDVSHSIVEAELTQEKLRDAGISRANSRQFVKNGLTTVHRAPMSYTIAELGLLPMGE